MRNYMAVLIATVSAYCCATSARADFINGGFEDGTLSGWSAAGAGPLFGPGSVGAELVHDTLLVGTQGPFAPFWTPTTGGGTRFASLWSSNFVFGSSFLSQSFTGAAGQVLSFDYFFDTSLSPFGPDVALGTLSGAASATLFEHNTPATLLAPDENIDWRHVEYTLPVSGVYTLSFAAIDGFGPGGIESLLGIDNVSLVPAPGAALLAAMGFGLVGWTKRRFA